MLGKPKYDYGDLVEFDIECDGKNYTVQGTVEIIDTWGTFESQDDVSYDIMAKESFAGKCLFKHFSEKLLRKVERNA